MPRPSSSTVTRAIDVDRDGDGRGVAGHRFVDRVVDDFVHEMMQTADGRITDVHARAFADVLQVGEVLEVLGGVRFAVAGRFLFVVLVVASHRVWICLFYLPRRHEGHGEER